MKKVIVVCVACLLLTAIVYAATTREVLYRKFGPMELEAIVLVVKDEVNLLRALHGLAPRTNQQIMDAIDNKMDGLTPYGWMEE